MYPPELDSVVRSHGFHGNQLLSPFSSTRHSFDWMESGMDSDVSEHLEPDEMYLMLQADMISIKNQKEALASEIEDIASDFKHMLQNAGLESEFPLHSNPSTPSIIRTTTGSFTRVSPLPTTSSEEDLLQQMMAAPIFSFTNSTSSGSYYEESAMTLIVDDNSNYVASPKPLPPQPDNTAMNVPNITDLSSSSDLSNSSVTSSDGYPKSSDTSSDDNQCVPECLDLEQELVSRIQCYGDFTIDRQRKINDMSVRFTGQSKPLCMSSPESEELFTREVEGCEDQDLIPPPVRVGPVIGSSLPDNCIVYSGTTSSGTDCSSPTSSSSRRRHRRRSNRTTSSHGSRKSSSNPRASSTMIEDYSPSSVSSSGSSRHKTNSIPRASSTMIEDTDLPLSKPGSAQCSSEEDLQSIYTWSIHDNSEDCSLEESYMKNFNHNHLVAKPPLPRKKVLSSNSSSSASSHRSSKPDIDNNNVHVDSVLPTLDALSVIEPSATLPVVESMCETTHSFKTDSLPRTSTRINLFSNKSIGSSMEARRSSMPDILSVCNHEEFHSVPNSVNNSTDDSSPLQERLELPGKSSSSSSHVSPPVLPNSTVDALCDSILTDSPTSVGSSGIYVPCNTPNPSDNSKASRSTNSDNRSEVCAPPSSVISAAAPVAPLAARKRSPSGIFKIPKNTTPLRKLFRFKRSKGKNNLISSTPNHVYPSSVRSDPVSKRTLFPFASKGSQESVQLLDKKAVIKKFKRFSASFNKRDRSGLTRIQTLANL